VRRSLADLVGRALEHEHVLLVVVLGLLDRDVPVAGHRELVLAARDLDGVVGDRHLDAGGDLEGLSSDSRHGYQTSQRTSPPTPFVRASLSVITPCDVDRMAMPRPLRTRGTCLAGT
jgi:hypothetical protein